MIIDIIKYVENDKYSGLNIQKIFSEPIIRLHNFPQMNPI